uniref:Uncharacterized protein n=1 Tax=Cannabis sativa TaxID=3483 RepID=A0A803QBD4_CANSA
MMTHVENLDHEEALKEDNKISRKLEKKEEVLKKAKNTIILSLSDQVLRKVMNEKTTHKMCVKLEQLYMSKTLPNQIYLKQRFYGFNMDESKSIDENIDEITKLVSNLESIRVKIEEDDQTIFLLNSLPRALMRI